MMVWEKSRRVVFWGANLVVPTVFDNAWPGTVVTLDVQVMLQDLLPDLPKCTRTYQDVSWMTYVVPSYRQNCFRFIDEQGLLMNMSNRAPSSSSAQPFFPMGEQVRNHPRMSTKYQTTNQ